MPTARAAEADGSIAERDDRLRVPIIICDECIVRGLSNLAIGRQIGISPETVKTHVRSIFAKSGTHSRAEFLDTVFRSG